MITKKDRAQAAERAMRHLAQECQDREEAEGLWFYTGLFHAYGKFSGYLSAQQIQEEIDVASEITPDFTLAYETELMNVSR